MFSYISGDILKSKAQCLVNTVNCEGYMGKGIAYQFKMRFPENNDSYVKFCKSKKLQIGTLHIFEEEGKVIVNFPTKNRWREKSSLEYICKGLERLVTFVVEKGIKSIAIPPLGCGNGGLSWAEVKPLIVNTFRPVQEKVDIQLYEPGKAFAITSIKRTAKPKLSHIVLMRLKLGLKEKRKIRLQKAAFLFNHYYGKDYFKFEKYLYGPYSHAIDILSKEIGEMQKFYSFDTAACYDYCCKQLMSNRVAGEIEKITIAAKKATDFINSLQTSDEVELVGTILFLIQNKSLTEDEIVKNIAEWSERKAERFSEKRIKFIIETLLEEGIISVNLLNQYEYGS